MAESERFSFGERLGVFLMVESASLSAAAVSILLSYVGYKTLRRHLARRKALLRPDVCNDDWMNTTFQPSLPQDERTDASDSSFFIGLMFAELVQAIGGLLNIRWIVDATVTEGPLCTTQGVFKQCGDVSVAFMSLTIAIQTFCILVLRCHTPPCFSKYILGGIFLFISLMVGISVATRTHSEKGAYYGNTGFWCWIGDNYRTEKIVFEYLWLWLAAFIMLVIYGAIAMVMRGILVVGDDTGTEDRWSLKWNWSSQQRRKWREKNRARLGDDEDEDEERRQAKAIANLMLFYPAVYICCVLPIGLVRWLAFSGHYVPPAATIFSSFVFSLSGLLNTILYVRTRPDLVKGGSDSNDADDTSTTSKSTGQRRGGEGSRRKKTKGSNKRISSLDPDDLGHLPDLDQSGGGDDDDDEGYLRESHTEISTEFDHPPWSGISKHSRSDSSGLVVYPTSRESIMLGHLRGKSQDTAYVDLHEISPPSERGGSLFNGSQEQQHQQQQKHRQPLSLDVGNLPDSEYYDIITRRGHQPISVAPDTSLPRAENVGRDEVAEQLTRSA